MHRKIGSSVLFVSALAVTAFGAPAGALNSATNAGSRMSVPVQPTPLPAPTFTVAAQGTPAAMTAADASVQAAAAIPAAVSPGVNAHATTHASAEGRANGLAVAEAAANQEPLTVNLAEAVKSIREASFAQRESITTSVQARLDAATLLLGELQAKAEARGEKSRAAYAAALLKVHEQETPLRASLKAAMQASSASSWREAQSGLARDYEAYARATAQAEAAVQGPDDAANPPKG